VVLVFEFKASHSSSRLLEPTPNCFHAFDVISKNPRLQRFALEFVSQFCSLEPLHYILCPLWAHFCIGWERSHFFLCTGTSRGPSIISWKYWISPLDCTDTFVDNQLTINVRA
jgi:hypothetical protein